MKCLNPTEINGEKYPCGWCKNCKKNKLKEKGLKMSKVIRINNETQELMERTKKEFIEACRESFNEAAKENLLNECLEWDRIITEANHANDSTWINKFIYSFRKNTGLEK